MTRAILLCGRGRSGSNRLLDMFDASPLTACRSETLGVPNGDFDGLPRGLFPGDFSAADIAQMDRALARAAIRRSHLDRLDQPDKAYFTPLARVWLTVMGRYALRRRARQLGFARGVEWTIPRACLRPAALAQGATVLKINPGPVWTDHLIRTGRIARIVHNIRDPRAYLRSWYNRFALGQDPEDFAATLPSLAPILDYFGAGTPDRLAALDAPALIEIELWRWRYTNERIWTEQRSRPDYTIVTYAEAEADLPATAERLYAFADLPMTPRVRDRIAAQRNTLFSSKHTNEMDPALLDRLIARVLGDSPLRAVPGLIEG